MHRSRLLAIAAVATLAVFILATVVEDIAVSRLSPLNHQISEYANDPRFGWIMTVGFAGWACSLLLSAAAIGALSGGEHRSVSLIIVGCLIAVAGLAMIVVAIAHTETVAGAIPRGRSLTASGRLHDIGSGVTTLALFLAAVAALRAIASNQRLLWLTRFAVVGAIVVDVVLLLAGSSVGGLRERLLLAVGCIWQAALLITSLRTQPRPSQASPRM